MEDSDEGSPTIGSNFENVVDREADVANETPDPQRPQLVGQTQLLVDQRFMVDLTKDENFDPADPVIQIFGTIEQKLTPGISDGNFLASLAGAGVPGAAPPC